MFLPLKNKVYAPLQIKENVLFSGKVFGEVTIVLFMNLNLDSLHDFEIDEPIFLVKRIDSNLDCSLFCQVLIGVNLISWEGRNSGGRQTTEKVALDVTSET